MRREGRPCCWYERWNFPIRVEEFDVEHSKLANCTATSSDWHRRSQAAAEMWRSISIRGFLDFVQVQSARGDVAGGLLQPIEIGRASCRERVWLLV